MWIIMIYLFRNKDNPKEDYTEKILAYILTAEIYL